MKKFNQTSKKLLIFLFVILLINTINAQVTIDIGKGELSIPESIDSKIHENLIAINQFAQQNFDLTSSGQRGTIKIDGSGGIIIESPSGKVFAEISDEVVIKATDKGLEISGRPEKYSNVDTYYFTAEIDGFKVDQTNINTPTTVRYSKKNGIKRIEVTEGTASISAGKVSVKSKYEPHNQGAKFANERGYNFYGISDAVIEVDENDEVRYANFFSKYGGGFTFEYKGQTFHFTTIKGKGGRIIFDPERGEISGENTGFEYSKKDGEIETNKMQLDGKFSFKLDKDGNLLELKVSERGIFRISLFGEGMNQEFFSTDDQPLHVFFDGRDIKDLYGNAISIADSIYSITESISNEDKPDRKIFIKGLVKGNGLKKAMNYGGQSIDAYTEFHYDGKKGEPGFDAYFDVKQGIAEIDNGIHLVRVEDGIIKLKVKKVRGGSEQLTDFGVSGYENGRETKIHINEKNEIFQVLAHDPKGNQVTTKISLSELGKKLTASIADVTITRERTKDNLESINKDLEQAIEKGIYRGEELTIVELEALKLRKAITENRIDRLDAEKSTADTLTDSISRVENLLEDNPNIDSDILASSNNILGELYLEKASQNSIDVKAIRAMDKIGNPKDGVYTYSETYSETEDIFGEPRFVDKQRNVHFRYGNGKWQWSSDKKTWSSSSRHDSIFDTLKELNPSPENYKNRRLFLDDILKSSGYFQRTISYYNHKYSTTGDEDFFDLAEQARLNDLKSYIVQDIEGAISDLRKLKGGKTSNQVRAEAMRLVASYDFSKTPARKAQETLQELHGAIRWDSDNKAAIQTLKDLKLGLLDQRQSIIHGEVGRSADDIIGIVGKEGLGDSILGTVDQAFSPISRIYYQFSGSLEERIEALEGKIGESEIRLLGSRGVERLIENDIDMRKYMSSDNTYRLSQVMRTHNLDTHISVDEFRRYAKGLSFSEEKFDTFNNDLRVLSQRIIEARGESLARAFSEDLGKASAIAGSIKNTIERDPAVHLIAGGGYPIFSQNDRPFYKNKEKEPLDNTAFTSGRMGKSLERSWAEAITLGTADFATTLLATGGAPGLIAKGFHTTTKALGLAEKAAKFGRVINLGRSILTPAETFANLVLKGKTARIIGGIMGEVGLGTTAPYVLGPEFGALYNTISIAGGYKGGAGKISRIADEAGNARIFMHAGKREVNDIGERLVSKGAIKADNLGPNIYKLNGDIIEVGSKIGSRFKVIATSNLDDLSNAMGRTARSTSKRLSDTGRLIDLPDNEIVRIRTNTFNRAERHRIAKAIKILDDAGFENEAKLLRTSPEHRQELLLGHYSLTIPGKVGNLMRKKFSRESIEVLAHRDNMILGNTYDNPRVISSVVGENLDTGKRSTSDIIDAVNPNNVDNIFTTDLSHVGDDLVGTKVVIYRNNDGKNTVAFFTESVDMHHSHVGAKLAELDLDAKWTQDILERFYKRELGGRTTPLMYRELGFELQFNKRTKKIIGVKMDSAITKSQQKLGIKINEGIVDDMIIDFFENIDPNLLDDRLKDLKWLGNPELLEQIKPSWLIEIILIFSKIMIPNP